MEVNIFSQLYPFFVTIMPYFFCIVSRVKLYIYEVIHMLFLEALVIACAFTYFCGNLLKKFPYVFYGLAIVLTVATSFVSYNTLPMFVTNYILGLFTKGALGTALFVIVMYTGALPQGHKLSAPLFKIRGELSIFAAFLVLSHNITYGKTYFLMLFQSPQKLPTVQLIAAIISCILIILMIVLTVTSFPVVRKKMNAKKWKQLQRSAYVFYGLMYVHIMLISFYYARFNLVTYRINTIIYSLVFFTYASLRIRKALLRKYSEKSKALTTGIAACFGLLFLGVSIFGASIHMPNADNSIASKDLNSELSEEESTLSTEEKTKKESSEDATDSTELSSEVVNEAPTDSPIVASSNTDQTPAQDTVADPNVDQTSPVQTEPVVTRKYKADGTYSGYDTVSEFGYDVSCTITISEDKIASVSFNTTDNGANATYISSANALANVLKRNGSSSGVDAMSGATYTSNAFMRAFDQAVNSAL